VNQNIPLFTAVALGATAMFMLDPVEGRRRRAIARSKASRLSHDTAQWLRARPGDIPDSQLVARVRAAIDRAVSHPSAVHVAVEDAIVCIDGAVLAREVDALGAAVRGVEGVMAIDNRVRACHSAADSPALEASRAAGQWRRFSRSPVVKVAAGVGGFALAVAVARAAFCSDPELAEPHFV
jgi:hypothetical protein